MQLWLATAALVVVVWLVTGINPVHLRMEMFMDLILKMEC